MDSRKLNFGCGFEQLDGWINVDKKDYGQEDKFDILEEWPYEDGWFEEVLANHVLHMFNYSEWPLVISKLLACLRTGGKLTVVEFDPLKAYKAYQKRDHAALIIPDDVEPTIDGKFGRYLTYHSTRRTIMTPLDMAQKLMLYGFSDARIIEPVDEQYGRINESFQVEGIK